MKALIALHLCGWVVAFIVLRKLRPSTCERCKHLIRKTRCPTQYHCDARLKLYCDPPEYCREWEPREEERYGSTDV